MGVSNKVNKQFCKKIDGLDSVLGEILDGLEDLVYKYAEFAVKNNIIREDVIELADKLREELDEIYNNELEDALDMCYPDD